jgi:hypothetical protein
MVEGVLERGGIAEDQSTLAKVVEDEAGQNETKPGEADRSAAEVAHVGVECLGPVTASTMAPSATKACQPACPNRPRA